MTEARMSLTDALRRGWDRMVRMLFRPFDLGKWLVVGFAAWLAGLAGSGFSYGGSSDSGGLGSHEGGGESLEDVAATLRGGWEWLLAHELVAGLIVAGVLVGLVLILLVLWVSSRGKFMFLDNVVHDRAEIARPWARYRRAGNSLFAFRLVATLICLGVAMSAIGGAVWLGLSAGSWEQFVGSGAIAGVVLAVAVGCLLALVASYLFFFLEAFVVPLMHRYDLGVMAAWRRFFSLAQGRWGWFLLSGILVFVLVIAAGWAILITGLMTCCLGFLLLMIPYVGTVLLLPLLVAYRAFTFELLAQVDPELLRQEAVE